MLAALVAALLTAVVALLALPALFVCVLFGCVCEELAPEWMVFLLLGLGLGGSTQFLDVLTTSLAEPVEGLCKFGAIGTGCMF